MRVLVLGSGGREHALVRALSVDPAVTFLACAPGNPGIGTISELHSVNILDSAAVVDLAQSLAIDLLVIGPEAPLVVGVGDAVRQAGIACFGPSKEAAQLEGSKAFAKEVMNAAGVPTARSYVCDTPEKAKQALDEFGAPYVVKDDALAAGKGVVVTHDRDEALAHAASCERVVIEEFLDGPEVSLFVVTDDNTAVPLLPAQDYKRIGDGDTGPNTGGVGAYCPLPWLPDGFVDEVIARVVEPTLAEMRKRGTPFSGLLYCGLALTKRGPQVIEFNARFGDPETQVVLAVLDTPLGQFLHAAATDKLHEFPRLTWRNEAAVAVVLCAEGYPDSPQTGDVINGAETPGILHAGTTQQNGELVTSGGRVATAVGVEPTLQAARESAYAAAKKVHFDHKYFRTDIALS